MVIKQLIQKMIDVKNKTEETANTMAVELSKSGQGLV